MSKGMMFVFAAVAAMSAPDFARAQTVASAERSADAIPSETQPLDRPARLEVTGVPLNYALTELSERSGVPIAFSPSRLETFGVVDCLCIDLTVAQALERLVTSRGQRYIELDEHIVIIAQPTSPPRQLSEPPRVPLFVRASHSRITPSIRVPRPVIPRDTVVAGVVVNARTLAPIAGVRVVVDGTSFGAVTDGNGRFRIQGSLGESVMIRAEMLGYRPQTELVRVGSGEVRLTLSESAIELNEVVVTGTAGAVQKRAIGNVVTSIDARQLSEIAPIPDVAMMINARAPGVLVESASGTVGGGSRIRIRGASSFRLTDQPLVYVDGIRVNSEVSRGVAGTQRPSHGSSPISRLNDINPADIERIEVLKGPAASTLYGTEAANGVVQIFTKRGSSDQRTRIDLTIRHGAAWFHNAENRLHENWYRDGNGELQALNITRREREAGRPIFRTGHQQGYDLGVAGGSELVNYFVSGSYDHDDGIEPSNKVRRFRSRVNIGFQPHSTMTVNTSLGVVSSTIDQHLENTGIWFATRFANGELLDTPLRGFTSRPPETVWRVFRNWEELQRFTGSLQISHQPFAWLQQRATLGFDLANAREHSLTRHMNEFDAQFYSPTAALGQKQVQTSNDEYNTIDYGATATFPVTEALTSSTSAGFQYYSRSEHRSRATGQEFPSIGLSVVDATAITTSREWSQGRVSAGFYVQQQLSWRDRFFVTGAVRGDDHSAFGDDFSVAYYPKGSVSWVISEEPWWNTGIVDNLRFRLAYGHSGQQPGTFAALRTYEPITTGYGTAALTPASVGNAELAPERGTEFETGFEVSFLDDRIGIDATYFSQRTRDALLTRQQPPSLGFTSSQLVNAGEISNRGLELQLRGTAVRRSNIDLSMGLNLSIIGNDVIDLGGDEFINAGGGIQHRVGFPVAAWYRQKVVSADVDQDGRAFNIMCDGGRGKHGVEQGGPAVPCADAPEVFIGRVDPSTEGAFQSTLTVFRRLTFYGMVDFKLGHFKDSAEFGGRCVTRSSCWENHHPHADPIFTAEVQNSDIFPTNQRTRDASFARLREVSASYHLPDAWAGRFGASRASLRVAARNLYTWTNWIGLDPESFRLSDQFVREEQDVMPELHQFAVTLNLSF